MMTTIEEIGTQLGMAIARDTMADKMPIQWSGLDAQDGDHIPPRMDNAAVEAVAKDVYFGELELAGFLNGQPVQRFRFATDSQHGDIASTSWHAAKKLLGKMLPKSALNDGAWGWVENTDGTRYEIGNVSR